jgi:hypothetical protein
MQEKDAKVYALECNMFSCAIRWRLKESKDEAAQYETVYLACDRSSSVDDRLGLMVGSFSLYCYDDFLPLKLEASLMTRSAGN